MTTRTKPKAAAKKPAPKAAAPEVAIIGGGLGGMTAALKLLQAGFKVTLFERYDRLGGNTASERVNGVEHDVYPHMFCDWYANFWQLFEHDLGLSREDHFVAHPGSLLREPGSGDYVTMLNPTSIEALLANLKSGAMSPAELLLLGYSGVDLASQQFDRDGLNQLGKLDVNGFLYSRGYATEAVAAMQNYLLTLVWSIDSDVTSAPTYGNFLQHSLRFPDHSPFDWLLRNSLNDGLIAPFRAKLEALGCTIRTGCAVQSVRLDSDHRPILRWQTKGAKRTQTKAFDYGVLAVPHEAMADLVMCRTSGIAGSRIVDAEPELANLRRLTSSAIPVLDLYLRVKLDGFPADNIGLAGSNYGLTALDISQLWPAELFGGKTALVVAASDGDAIPSEDPEQAAMLMLAEFARYYPQFAGIARWGDPDCIVDWAKTHIRLNAHHKLFLDDTGSWAFRPAAAYPETLPRLAFGGDLCRTDVEMATMEGAVQSGTLAAAAVQAQDARITGLQRGKEIADVPHRVYSPTTFRAAKLLLLPSAYAAYALVALDQYRAAKAAGDDRAGEALATLVENLALVLPKAATEAGEGAYWFYRSLVDKDEEDPGDEAIGLGAAALMVLGEIADYAASHLGGEERPVPETGAAKAFEGIAGEIAGIAGRAFGAVRDAAANGNTAKRRWRVKS
ncbi:FAD-dependent oxidoreductase [Parerythrobacter lacustris]|uniref:FAD-dependent oxidoreductase n=1 Tax=Parerythrobacter lacustris TaxID=2969984 RepID=A0ABT1XL21_9SPHN|nr:FAD-dependent oxidoreductase [Parerythrobacter lacustris]MCR2832361.1 FAD-dependent oxidoreductase [Parerythrobacter lacustris]